MEEVERVLTYPKFGLATQEVKIILTPLMNIAEIVIPTSIINIIERCPADNRVLECAFDGKCSVIVTGDRRDLLSIKKYHNIEIVTIRSFLDRLN